jgi:hypothetical protein
VSSFPIAIAANCQLPVAQSAESAALSTQHAAIGTQPALWALQSGQHLVGRTRRPVRWRRLFLSTPHFLPSLGLIRARPSPYPLSAPSTYLSTALHYLPPGTSTASPFCCFSRWYAASRRASHPFQPWLLRPLCFAPNPALYHRGASPAASFFSEAPTRCERGKDQRYHHPLYCDRALTPQVPPVAILTPRSDRSAQLSRAPAPTPFTVEPTDDERRSRPR